MVKKRKTAFLILRVDPEFKEQVMKMAKDAGQTVSQMVRNLLNKKI